MALLSIIGSDIPQGSSYYYNPFHCRTKTDIHHFMVHRISLTWLEGSTIGVKRKTGSLSSVYIL